MTETTNGRYLLLDAMRGIGAIAVLHYHTRQIYPLGLSGYLAVDFFFALSGFVLSKAYIRKLELGMKVSEFMISRGFRLYPLYLTGMGMGLFIAVIQLWRGTGGLNAFEIAVSILFNSLMLPTPVPVGELFPLNTPSWSLFWEMCISACFAIFLFKQSIFRLFILVILSGSCLAMSILQYNWLGGWNWENAHIGALRVLFSFTIGVLIAHTSSKRIRSYWSVALCAAMLAILYMPHDIEETAARALIVIILLNPLFLWVAVKVEIPQRFEVAAKFLGDISFPLYVTHMSLIPVFNRIVEQLTIHPLVHVLALTVASVASAYVINVVVQYATPRILNTRKTVKSG